MSAPTLVARCPAKVNLGLRVLGRRPDGYHELRTVFQTIDLWDELEASPSEGWSLACDDPALAVDGSNLVLRAASRLALAAGGGGRGAAFRLRKHVPIGGGLGGGSSDAAGALLLLARMWGTAVRFETLVEIASEIGADVPFFLHGGTALGTGRGDRIERLADAGPIDLLLGIAPFAVPTAEAYAGLGSMLTPRANDVSLGRRPALKWPGGKDLEAVNDLETTVYDRWPDLRVFRDALREEGAEPALLSGSGSTVFGVFEDRERVFRARDRLARRFVRWTLRPTRAIREGVVLSEKGRHERR